MRRLFAVLLLSSGCVTQGTYDALKAEHEATKSELTKRSKALADREQALSAAQQAMATLERNLAALKQEREELQRSVDDAKARLQELDGRLAKMVKDKSSLESSVQEMTAALRELQRRKAEADARLAEFRSLLAKFKSLIDAGKLKVRIVEGRMVVVLATDVLFASGSATLSKEGKAAVAEVAQLLASIPNRKFQVEGHTDNVPTRNAQFSNWELASARALTVLKTMIDAGMPTDRISAASFGESKPATSNDTPEGRAANRRIEIIIVPDLSTLPGFEELNRIERGS